ncbi:methyltransferase domain-containing protein [Hahella sp. KA22]|uniref:class I SAM-dependent methyltransferase n=1 Tax=Hahella sp. KA22 TaxID=1628392 RepID=UPI000FDEC894|nr:class I SAM-dependent methyltransferase [Hahella sp. KA22]AZZ90902.1 class I SAM-dependent methyltransferase [Hahella sp. KA22]QAY54272.1 methyltransferase domain-containing protein [Hahella sp. KA22]
MKIIQKIRKKLLGFDKNHLLAQVEQQKQQIEQLTTIVCGISGSSSSAWLLKNKDERMDATDELFDEARRNFHLMRYEFASNYCNGLDVADIACGTGYGSEILALEGKANSVTGIDIDSSAISYAKQKHGPANTSYKVASADDTGLPSASLDLIVSFETIEHLPPSVDILKEFHRVLKPSSTLIISTPNNWPLTKHHLRTYNFSSFKEDIEKYFRIEIIYNQNSGSKSEYNHNQPAGITHTTIKNQDLAECFIAVCRKDN